MALDYGPYSVIDNLTWHDPLTYRKVTGTFDFPDDHHTAKKKWWCAVRGAPNAHGSIVLDPGVITGITVAAAGSGYTVAPTCTLTGGNGTGATVTATLTTNYGSGATGTAVIAAGAVSSVTVTAGGSSYVTAPTVAFSGGGGTGATATATIASGVVTAVTITAGGSGYTSAPTVTFTAVVTGTIAAFTLTSAGSGYTAAPTLTLSTGSGATGTAVVASGAVGSVTITAGGSGYVAAPTVAFSGGGGTGAAGTAIIAGGVVTGVTVTAGGSGYTSTPTVTFTAVGSGGRGTVVFTAGHEHVDATAALAVPGVHGVYWYVNNASFSSSWTNYGVAIVGVVADDLDTAEYACTLVKVDCNALTVVYDADAAALPTAPIDGKGSTTSNISTSTFTRGSVTGSTGFAAADKTITVNTGWYRTMMHNPIQPKTAMVYEDGGEWYSFCSSQSSATSNTIATIVPSGSLRNIHDQKHSVGGGFGDGESTTQASMAARCSLALNGHPVVVKLSRYAANHIGSRQYDTDAQLTIGVKNDGTLVAMSGNWNGGNGGASAMAYGLLKTYTCPNVSFTYTTININTPARGAWRCVSDEPGGEAYEPTLDRVAAALGMDPYAFRQKNIMAVDALDQDSPFSVWSGRGVNAAMALVYQKSSYATKSHAPGQGPVRADGRKHGIAITGHQDSHGGVSGTGRYGHLILGTDGLVTLYHGGGNASTGPQGAMIQITAETMGLAFADVKLVAWSELDYCRETAGMQNGSTHTAGAGSAYYSTALYLRNLVFDRAVTLTPYSTFLPVGRTKPVATATITNGMVTGFTITTAGSGFPIAPIVALTAAPSTGTSATAVAGIDNNGALVSITCTNPGSGYTTAPTVTIYGVTHADLDAANSTIFLRSDPTNTTYQKTYASTVSGWIAQPSIGTGWGSTLKWGTIAGKALGTSCNSTGSSAACCELLVDPETGDVQVLNYWNADSTGTTINAVAVQKEIGSGIEAGMGQAMWYGDVYDPNTAAVLGAAHGCFQHPTTLDFDPTTFHIYDVQNFDLAGPFGAHGMAEPGSTNAPSVQCAIYNALNHTNPLNPYHGACSQDIILAALGLS